MKPFSLDLAFGLNVLHVAAKADVLLFRKGPLYFLLKSSDGTPGTLDLSVIFATDDLAIERMSIERGVYVAVLCNRKDLNEQQEDSFQKIIAKYQGGEKKWEQK